MENNEITMQMDVKFDIHDKRPDSLKFKVWTRCQVKVEAIKCLPCFLRITFRSSTDEEAREPQTTLTVSINVPGVTVSLAASRTKQYSYGLFWMQNRRDCFIYFALDTEASCRRHMKWIKKSIKNLELHRQIFLEERRSSRDTGRIAAKQGVAKRNGNGQQLETTASAYKLFGPLPKIPDSFDGNRSSWSRRVSRASEIYEEIFEGIQGSETPRLSRRLSRTSIASGIYEEMRPTANHFNAIVEELLEQVPPPIPPLPPPRKRINTFETDMVGLLGEIPRSNTNPESEMAKKKKYKNVFDIFSTTRGKRAESVSETQACSVEELISDYATPKYSKSDNAGTMVVYSNCPRPHTKHAKRSKTSETKRNSFSNPDLSKINLLDSLYEEGVANILFESFGGSDDLCLDHESLDESAILFGKSTERLPPRRRTHLDYLENFNISQQIPNNFNFSACNTSTINLIGANGAVPLPNTTKNKILVDDLTGYCIMAPIVKRPTIDAKSGDKVHTATETASSGYSTGSYSSTTSSCAQSSEDRPARKTSEITAEKNPLIATTETYQAQEKAPSKEDSVIYENMLGSLNSSNVATDYSKHVSTPPSAHAFSNNLYENLLTVKAAQELEMHTTPVLSTSTPTESPLTHNQAEEESYYQTPRKSIISVDDKIPSYYPNSCDTTKMRRRSNSPSSRGLTPTIVHNEKSSTSTGTRHSSATKVGHDRKENVYISSPQQIIEHRNSDIKSTKSLTQKLKSKAAQKISENVYAVKHGGAKKPPTNNNNQPGFTEEMKEKLQTELLQLALLQNIDFKFDDAKNPGKQPAIGVPLHSPDDPEDENKHNTENFWQRLGNTTPQGHHLQLNQASNTKSPKPLHSPSNTAGSMSRSSKLEKPTASVTDLNVGGVKKFASLPRFKKIDFSPLKMRINNVLQRHQQQDF